ncbi:hypothetical protein F383_01639 [Gossypium arboreum]|uniref:Uncharacterized protein n=1 Tax=Gossypium arboreum TaxID=29729 RepID=A0A0B0NQ55_GOSAR|nr:hypothetical protein F383_01639 [Gossypium arboreum]
MASHMPVCIARAQN